MPQKLGPTANSPAKSGFFFKKNALLNSYNWFKIAEDKVVNSQSLHQS